MLVSIRVSVQSADEIAMEFPLPRLIVRQSQVEADDVERDSGHVDRDGDKGTLCDYPLWGEAVLDGECEEDWDDVETDNGQSSHTRVPLPSTTASSTSSHACGDVRSTSERHPPAAVVIGQRLGRGEDVRRAVAANSRSSRPRPPPQRTRREEYSLGHLHNVRTMSNKVRHCVESGEGVVTNVLLYSAIIMSVVSTRVM